MSLNNCLIRASESDLMLREQVCQQVSTYMSVYGFQILLNVDVAVVGTSSMLTKVVVQDYFVFRF